MVQEEVEVTSDGMAVIDQSLLGAHGRTRGDPIEVEQSTLPRKMDIISCVVDDLLLCCLISTHESWS